MQVYVQAKKVSNENNRSFPGENNRSVVEYKESVGAMEEDYVKKKVDINRSFSQLDVAEVIVDEGPHQCSPCQDEQTERPEKHSKWTWKSVKIWPLVVSHERKKVE